MGQGGGPGAAAHPGPPRSLPDQTMNIRPVWRTSASFGAFELLLDAFDWLVVPALPGFGLFTRTGPFEFFAPSWNEELRAFASCPTFDSWPRAWTPRPWHPHEGESCSWSAV